MGGGSGTGGTGASAGAGGSAGSAGSAGTGGGGGGGDCVAACEKITAQGCSNEPDQATCVTDCEQDIVGSATCGTEGEAVIACIANTATVSCDGEGDAQFEGCNTELSAWLGCAACDEDDDDTPCDTCQKTACCSELKAFFGDPDAWDFQACIDPCGDDAACQQDCFDQYPDPAADLVALAECFETKCATECP